MFNNILNFVILLFAIYGLVATAGIISERSGVVNIGLNANILAGALGALIFHGLMGLGAKNAFGADPVLWVDMVSLIFSGLFGVVVSMLFSLATITLKADHVIVGTAMNILVPAVVFVFLFMDSKSTDAMFAIKATSGIALVASENVFGNFDFYNLIYLAITAAIMGGMWFMIRYTRLGLRIWASGENPHALAAAGVDVHRTRFFAQFIVGFIAGVAGGMQLKYDAGSFTTLSAGGIGFVAIALLVIAQWRIHWAALVVSIYAIIMGVLRGFQDDIQVNLFQGAVEVFQIIPYVLPLIALPFFRNVSNMPKHDGLIYDAGQR